MTIEKRYEFEQLLLMNNRIMSDLESGLRKVELSSSAFLALQFIGRNQRPNTRQATRADVARHLGTTPASVSVLVKRMLERQWITERARNDQSLDLSLTEDGRLQLRLGTNAWCSTFRDIDKMLTSEMKTGFLKSIGKINMVYKHREGEAQLKRLANTYRGKDKDSKEWKQKAKVALRRYREETKAKEHAWDES